MMEGEITRIALCVCVWKIGVETSVAEVVERVREGTVTIGLTRTVHGRVLQPAVHKENTIIIAFRSKGLIFDLTIKLFSPFSVPHLLFILLFKNGTHFLPCPED